MTLPFTSTVQTMLGGREVHIALGVKFEFLSSTEYIWLGRGTFKDSSGNQWLGMGEMASLDGLQFTNNLSVDPVTMTLSGVPLNLLNNANPSATGQNTIQSVNAGTAGTGLVGPTKSFLQLVKDQANEIRNRYCGIYLLTFDSSFQQLDVPYLTERYVMDKASYSVDGESQTVSITVYAEPLFSTKHIPATAFMSNADQQRKYAGDKIFERVCLLSGKQTVVWSADS